MCVCLFRLVRTEEASRMRGKNVLHSQKSARPWRTRVHLPSFPRQWQLLTAADLFELLVFLLWCQPVHRACLNWSSMILRFKALKAFQSVHKNPSEKHAFIKAVYRSIIPKEVNMKVFFSVNCLCQSINQSIFLEHYKVIRVQIAERTLW